MAQSPPVTVIVLVFVGVIVTAIVLIILFAFACRFVRDSSQVSSVSNIAIFGVPSTSIRRLRGLSKEEIERACPLVVYSGPHNLLVDVDQDREANGDENIAELPNVNSPSIVFQQSFQEESIKSFQEGNVPSAAEENDFTDSRKSYGYGKYRVPDGICAVCLEQVSVGTYLRMLPCQHAFHDSCITHWLLCANRCPLCNCPAYERPVEAATEDVARRTVDDSRSVAVNVSENQEEGTRSLSVTDQELLASLSRQSTRPTGRLGRLWTFIRFGPYATASEENLTA